MYIQAALCIRSTQPQLNFPRGCRLQNHEPSRSTLISNRLPFFAFSEHQPLHFTPSLDLCNSHTQSVREHPC